MDPDKPSGSGENARKFKEALIDKYEGNEDDYAAIEIQVPKKKPLNFNDFVDDDSIVSDTMSSRSSSDDESFVPQTIIPPDTEDLSNYNTETPKKSIDKSDLSYFEASVSKNTTQNKIIKEERIKEPSKGLKGILKDTYQPKRQSTQDLLITENALNTSKVQKSTEFNIKASQANKLNKSKDLSDYSSGTITKMNNKLQPITGNNLNQTKDLSDYSDFTVSKLDKTGRMQNQNKSNNASFFNPNDAVLQSRFEMSDLNVFAKSRDLSDYSDVELSKEGKDKEVGNKGKLEQTKDLSDYSDVTTSKIDSSLQFLTTKGGNRSKDLSDYSNSSDSKQKRNKTKNKTFDLSDLSEESSNSKNKDDLSNISSEKSKGSLSSEIKSFKNDSQPGESIPSWGNYGQSPVNERINRLPGDLLNKSESQRPSSPVPADEVSMGQDSIIASPEPNKRYIPSPEPKKVYFDSISNRKSSARQSFDPYSATSQNESSYFEGDSLMTEEYKMQLPNLNKETIAFNNPEWWLEERLFRGVEGQKLFTKDGNKQVYEQIEKEKKRFKESLFTSTVDLMPKVQRKLNQYEITLKKLDIPIERGTFGNGRYPKRIRVPRLMKGLGERLIYKIDKINNSQYIDSVYLLDACRADLSRVVTHVKMEQKEALKRLKDPSAKNLRNSVESSNASKKLESVSEFTGSSVIREEKSNEVSPIKKATVENLSPFKAETPNEVSPIKTADVEDSLEAFSEVVSATKTPPTEKKKVYQVSNIIPEELSFEAENSFLDESQKNKAVTKDKKEENLIKSKINKEKSKDIVDEINNLNDSFYGINKNHSNKRESSKEVTKAISSKVTFAANQSPSRMVVSMRNNQIESPKKDVSVIRLSQNIEERVIIKPGSQHVEKVEPGETLIVRKIRGHHRLQMLVDNNPIALTLKLPVEIRKAKEMKITNPDRIRVAEIAIIREL